MATGVTFGVRALALAVLGGILLMAGCGTPSGSRGPGSTCELVRSASVGLTASYYPTVEVDGRSYYWHGFGIIFATTSEVTDIGTATCIPESGIVSPTVYALVGIDPSEIVVLESDPPSELPPGAAIPPDTSPYGLFLRDGRSEGPREICRFYLQDTGPSECVDEPPLEVPSVGPAPTPHGDYFPGLYPDGLERPVWWLIGTVSAADVRLAELGSAVVVPSFGGEPVEATMFEIGGIDPAMARASRVEGLDIALVFIAPGIDPDGPPKDVCSLLADAPDAPKGCAPGAT